ncbi:MAG: 4-alpha-glucanotransferase [Wenzhouxiangella sp.]|nr:MAG: 4-alpha-glucanotransferase [Wenzhouxiangella sp.]
MKRDLGDQAAARGIASGYHDISGQWQPVSEASLEQLLEALGPPGELASFQDAPEPAPANCFLPPSLRAGQRRWGISVQLYGLRSRSNWGIGDFGDLGRLVELAAAAGAAAVQVSPLHALFSARPENCSPYAPSSRLFLNPLYIDIHAVPELAELPALAERIQADAYQAELNHLRQARWLDYPAVAAKKIGVLGVLYQHFRDHHLACDSDRAGDFRRYCRAAGQPLERFALFEALDAEFVEQGIGRWQDWPAELRAPDPQTLDAALAARRSAVDFHRYLQWLARSQLETVQARARAAGMDIGLIADLAIGSEPSGADVWSDPTLFATAAEIGAPPDAFAADGQAWGLPPWRPQVLVERSFSPLRELLAATMVSVGALRLDHVIGLQRQFWVPRGQPGRAGAYLAYPREALFAEVAACSHRHRCLVIGEDLGTVPEGFRERMAASSMLSTRVLPFERYPNGLFKRPSTYPELAVACAGTHDLPTLAAWLADETNPDHQLLHAALVDAGCAPPDWPDPATADAGFLAAAIDATHGFLAATPSALVLVQLEDLLAETEPANRPGTGPEQPNWQRRYRVDLAELPRLEAWRHCANSMRGRAVSGTV